MVREGYVLTRLEATEIFLIMGIARLKLPESTTKTMAQRYWKKFESALGLQLEEIKSKQEDKK